jgi:hypothetical protein
MVDKQHAWEEHPAGNAPMDSYSTLGSAVLEPLESAPAEPTEWTGVCCEKCNAPLASDVVSICRRCGWYASLNQFVEVDQEWEAFSEAEPETEEKSQPENLLDFVRKTPRWAWLLIASVLCVAIESLAVRLAAPADGGLRTRWAVSQLAIGLFAALGCHVFNFVVQIGEDSEIGLLDLFLKPVKLWNRAVGTLPERFWVLNSASSGLAAVFCAVLVIGGIPYERLWDWGIAAPPKQDLMAAVMQQVQKLDSGDADRDLEQSINDFAGKAGDESDGNAKAEEPKPKQTADCVILGYRADPDGRVSTLVLGTAEAGQLVYAGNVTPKLPPEEMQLLLAMLRSIETHRPLIQIEYEAKWVQPNYACRVSYGERTRSGRLHEVEWSQLLGNIGKR